MTTRTTGNLPDDAVILRTIARAAGRNLGVYATVALAGGIKVGDRATLD